MTKLMQKEFTERARIRLEELITKAEDERAQADYSPYNSPERFNAEGSCNAASGYLEALLDMNVVSITEYEKLHCRIWGVEVFHVLCSLRGR